MYCLRFVIANTKLLRKLAVEVTHLPFEVRLFGQNEAARNQGDKENILEGN